MTVRLEGSAKRYVGLSSDTKPELEAKDAGSSYFAEDTGLVSRWTGRTWADPSPRQDLSQELLAAVQRSNDLLEQIAESL